MITVALDLSVCSGNVYDYQYHCFAQALSPLLKVGCRALYVE